jgi:hypothetical protein
MTERKQPEPFTVLAGAALIFGMGLVLFVFTFPLGAIPGVAFMAYGLIIPGVAAVEHAYNALERFADWWFEGRSTPEESSEES